MSRALRRSEELHEWFQKEAVNCRIPKKGYPIRKQFTLKLHNTAKSVIGV